MKRCVRKLGKQDFHVRVGRVDWYFAKNGYAKAIIRNRNERPVMWAFAAFIWILFVISIAENRTYLETSLVQGSLPAEMHGWVFYALGGLIMISAVTLGFHFVRYVFKPREFRGASGSVLVGALGAILLNQAPPDLLQDGFSALTGTSQLLAAAMGDGARDVTGLNISSVRFVSDLGR